MTGIWTMRPDWSDSKRIGMFLGEPGTLEFLPGSQELGYMERGLSYVGFLGILFPDNLIQVNAI